MSYASIPPNATLKPTPFEAKVPDTELNDFEQLLRLSKLGPKTFENQHTDRSFGVDYAWLEKAKAYWEDDFDWRKTEAETNSFPNFTVPINNGAGGTLTVHFAALFSKKKDAVPLLLLHGWPGSFLEFLPMLGLLKEKYSADELPYHVVVPSLPGYGYSAGPPLDRNWGKNDIARTVDALMVGLGLSGYLAQGGDIGSYAARILAVEYEACKAVHLNFNLGAKPPHNHDESTLPQNEQTGLARARTFLATGSAYATEHGTRPATIGHVLSASPLSLLAWIAEKFLAWTDTDPTLDTILSSVTLYWFTSSFPRAIYPYRETSIGNRQIHGDPKYFIKKPFGFSYFPMELGPVPRAWTETTGELSFWRSHESGGHFAAMECPAVLLGDLEDFVEEVWGMEGSKL